ncbi:MAG: septum formation initiator family protein [Patescibacteria group bacterium]
MQTNQPNFWSIITSRIFFTIALIATVALVFGIIKSAIRKAEVSKQIQGLRSDIRSLESRNEQLARLIDYFKTDEFKEREARLRLGLQKPGEQVTIIPGVEDNKNEPAPVNIQENRPNWRKWFDYFFN